MEESSILDPNTFWPIVSIVCIFFFGAIIYYTQSRAAVDEARRINKALNKAYKKKNKK